LAWAALEVENHCVRPEGFALSENLMATLRARIMQAGESTEPLRLDKWLWAARFFKTRSLAAEAVAGGKVQLNSLRAKPSRTVRIGDEITVRRGPYESTVVVRDLGKQRGPASQAQQLYKETEESKQARELLAAQLKLQCPPRFEAKGRPSKKSRRELLRFTRRGR
jgi:ribosome-associated heat shock protein Hsp15